MFKPTKFLSAFMLGCAIGGFAALANGHALWDPQGLVKPRSNRDDIKTGPCGEPRGNNPVTLAAGATVDLSIKRTIYHQGYFRIAFAPANDLGFDDYVLADRVAENSSQGFYQVSVTLPDMECERCTLQLIQVMLDRNPPTNYYSCADIRLVRASADLQPPASVGQLLATDSDGNVLLNWTNPGDTDFAGVLMTEGEMPLNAVPHAGRLYAVGDALGNSTVVLAGAANNQLLTGRSAGQTYHYNLFAFDQSYNYAPAVTTQVAVTENLPNMAPTLRLVAEQNGQVTSNITTGGGRIIVQAQISDANAGDLHQLNWQADPRLLDLDSVAEQFTFDPAALSAGNYAISVTVTDDGRPPLSTTETIDLKLDTSARTGAGSLQGGTYWWLLMLISVWRLRSSGYLRRQ